MEIKKVGVLLEEEVAALVSAGKVLRGLSEAYSAKEVDTFDESAVDLFKALADVLHAVIGD